MSPILLKPAGDNSYQLIIHGKVMDMLKTLSTYLHILFDAVGFRRSFLEALWKNTGKKTSPSLKPIPSLTGAGLRNKTTIGSRIF